MKKRNKEMHKKPELIVMLIHNDVTVSNAYEVFELLHLQKSECICVGDQIFTDIYGANKCGIDSVLVDFIRLPEEKWFGKRRILEKIILKCCDIQRGGKWV